MTSFTNTFGGSAVSPADVAYRAFDLSANTQLYWPQFAAGNANTAARFMNVNPTASNLALSMPDATLASNGTDVIVSNVGSTPFTILSYTGTTIATLQPGQQWYVILTDNSTTTGTWFVLQFGVGNSSAQASALAGLGLNAIGPLLNLNFGVTDVSTNFTATEASRATVFIWQGGAGTGTLPDASTVGAGFAVGVANVGAGDLVMTPVNGQLIDGAATSTFSLTQSGFLVSDGTNWYSVGKGLATNFAVTLLNKNVSGGANVVLTSAEAQNIIQQYTGVLTNNIAVVVPNTVQLYYVFNNTSGAFTLQVKTAAGTGFGVQQGGRSILYCDGTNVVNAFSFVPSGNQQFPAASASAPSIAFQNGPDSGFFSPGAHQVGVSAAGFEVMQWAAQASSVNFIQALATATGVAPILSVMGNDTNVHLQLAGQGTGGILTPVGAVATPGLLVGEATTGFWRPGAGIVALSLGGVETVRWNGSAQVMAVPLTLTANNVFLQQWDSGSALRNILGVDSASILQIGSVSLIGANLNAPTTATTQAPGNNSRLLATTAYADAAAAVLPTGATNDLVYYAVNGAALSLISAADSSILITSPTGVPSLSTALPLGITATTQPIADNSTKLATTAYADRAGAVSNQNVVSSSRAFNTVYHNTTSKPIYVSVVCGVASGSASYIAMTDSNSTPTTTVAQALFNTNVAALSLFFIVLPGNYYEVTQTGSTGAPVWVEWT